MNKHIELVKKYLADNDSVTIEELRINSEAAYDTAAAYNTAAAAGAAAAAAAASYNPSRCPWAAAHYEKAMEYVRKYEELTK